MVDVSSSRQGAIGKGDLRGNDFATRDDRRREEFNTSNLGKVTYSDRFFPHGRTFDLLDPRGGPGTEAKREKQGVELSNERSPARPRPI